MMGESMVRTAFVSSIESTNHKAKVHFEGDSEATNKFFRVNKDITVSEGDRVLCVRKSGTYIIICRI